MRRRSRRDENPGSQVGSRPLLLLAVTVFLDLLGFGLILPNIPRYIETAVGDDHAHAAAIGGLLAASYSFTQFLFAPMWGRYSDRVGRRPVLLLSLIGIAGSFTLFGLAEDHLWVLFAARLLAGLLSSASIGVAFAYVADVTTPENRARGIGLLGASFGMGFILGPAVGGVLGHYGLGVPAFTAAAMALVNFCFTLRFLPESLTDAARQQAQALGAFSIGLLARVIRGPAGFLFALTFLVTFAFSALEQTFSFYLLSVFPGSVRQDNQPLISGLILGMAGLVAVVVQGGLIGRLVARYGEGGVAIAGLAFMAVGFGLFPLPRHLWALVAGPMLLLSVGSALTRPAFSALVSRKANLGQGLTLSTSQSFDSLARTFGPITSGWLFSAFGPHVPYVTAAVVMALALGLGLARRGDMALREPLANPLQGI